MDCKNCGLPAAETDENCPNCGAPKGPFAITQQQPSAEPATAHKWPFNPIAAACCGVGVFVVFVVACWLIWTLYAFYHSPSSMAPLAKPMAAPPVTPSAESGPAFAVSDIEGGSESDRKSFDGKSITVEGYVSSVSASMGEISDTAGGVPPKLKITGELGTLKVGTKSKFAGKYIAATRTLSVATVRPE